MGGEETVEERPIHNVGTAMTSFINIERDPFFMNIMARTSLNRGKTALTIQHG
jgi:hypothetical protein